MTAYLWQVALHSGTMGLILYIWVHRVGLPSGRTRQHLLGLLLVLPMVTAAVPWRSSVEFGERVAWLNSARLLAIPLPFADGRVHVAHLVVIAGLLTVIATVWQEVMPALRHVLQSTGRSISAPPAALVASARALDGWARCDVRITADDTVEVVTTGRPGHPRLLISRGALAALSPDELDAVLAHEHAHWQGGRWWRTHALFLVRLLQSYNPVALWAFREYCIEDEIACDAAAAAGRDPRLLARVLLRVYQTTDGRDLAARAGLRKRVDVLLAGGTEDRPVPAFMIPAVSILMLVVLPWLV